MSTTNSPYQKAGQQSAVISVSSPPLQIGAIQGNLTVASSNTVSGGPFGGQTSAFPPLRSDQLQGEVFQMNVDQLADLWLARFGNDWISIENFIDDPFWSVAYQRLKTLGEVEVHYLTDRAQYVCRRPR